MNKSFSKLSLATFLLTITLTSFTFAGETQCPLQDPPPPPPAGNGGRMAPIDNTIPKGSVDISESNDHSYLQGFWEFLALNNDLF